MMTLRCRPVPNACVVFAASLLTASCAGSFNSDESTADPVDSSSAELKIFSKIYSPSPAQEFYPGQAVPIRFRCRAGRDPKVAVNQIGDAKLAKYIVDERALVFERMGQPEQLANTWRNVMTSEYVVQWSTRNYGKYEAHITCGTEAVGNVSFTVSPLPKPKEERSALRASLNLPDPVLTVAGFEPSALHIPVEKNTVVMLTARCDGEPPGSHVVEITPASRLVTWYEHRVQKAAGGPATRTTKTIGTTNSETAFGSTESIDYKVEQRVAIEFVCSPSGPAPIAPPDRPTNSQVPQASAIVNFLVVPSTQ